MGAGSYLSPAAFSARCPPRPPPAPDSRRPRATPLPRHGCPRARGTPTRAPATACATARRGGTRRPSAPGRASPAQLGRASRLPLFDDLDRVVDVLRPEAGLHDEAQREVVADRPRREVQDVLVGAPELARRVAVVEAAPHLHHLPPEQEVVLDGAADRLAPGGLHHDLHRPALARLRVVAGRGELGAPANGWTGRRRGEARGDDGTEEGEEEQ